MKQQEYKDACARTEHKDLDVHLRNRRSGEVGTVIQCSGFDTPAVFLVRSGDAVTSWTPDEVDELKR